MPTTDAQGRTVSDDGQWWWDGTAWQPIKKGFLDAFADSVEGAVKKIEGSQTASPASTPLPNVEAAPPAASEPIPADPPTATPAGVAPVIPAADLLAYLGALRGAAVVTDDEFESIRKRIPGQA
jgi:hypothetical protein